MWQLTHFSFVLVSIEQCTIAPFLEFLPSMSLLDCFYVRGEIEDGEAKER